MEATLASTIPGAKLVVPPGALSANASICLGSATNVPTTCGDARGPVVHVAGAPSFALPAQLTLPITEVLDSDPDPNWFVQARIEGEGIRRVPIVSKDTKHVTVTVDVLGPGDYQVFEAPSYGCPGDVDGGGIGAGGNGAGGAGPGGGGGGGHDIGGAGGSGTGGGATMMDDPPAPPFASVSAGHSHTCAVSRSGGALCWGDNSYGQLGDDVRLDDEHWRSSPRVVKGLASGVKAISAGEKHTCALTEAGGVKCWGSNERGRLGQDDSVVTSTVPIDVAGLQSGVKAISAGGPVTCAVTTDGHVKCWGANIQGVLGDGSSVESSATPVDTGITNAVEVAVSRDFGGSAHACARTDAGAVLCWGSNPDGQLGDGTDVHDGPTCPGGDFACRSRPGPVMGLTAGATSIAVGDAHSCAVVSGGLVCWGNGEAGQCGGGGVPGIRIKVPQPVSGLAQGVTAVTAGANWTCALLASGQVRCLGSNNAGTLGNGTAVGPSACSKFACSLTPVDVSGVSGATAISAGGGHTCALVGDKLECWGNDGNGELGDRVELEIVDRAVSVTGLGSGVTSLSAGDSTTCAVTSGGAAKCWGDDSFAQLGSGAMRTAANVYAVGSKPVAVAGLDSGVKTVVASGWNACALTNAGAVHCWGANQAGQLGVSYMGPQLCGDLAMTNAFQNVGCTLSPIQEIPSGATAIAVGGGHACALTATGVTCWGGDHDGELGNGVDSNSPNAQLQYPPSNVAGLPSGTQEIAVGFGFTCALTQAGGVKCWGSNDQFGLGDRSLGSNSKTPIDVPGLTSGVAHVYAGAENACALLTSGKVDCWGGGNSVTEITGIGGTVKSMSVSGTGKVCALLTTGVVTCWGEPDSSASQSSFVPKPLALAKGAAVVAFGGAHTCVLGASGDVACWGDARRGQRGDGAEGARLTPVTVK